MPASGWKFGILSGDLYFSSYNSGNWRWKVISTVRRCRGDFKERWPKQMFNWEMECVYNVIWNETDSLVTMLICINLALCVLMRDLPSEASVLLRSSCKLSDEVIFCYLFFWKRMKSNRRKITSRNTPRFSTSLPLSLHKRKEGKRRKGMTILWCWYTFHEVVIVNSYLEKYFGIFFLLAMVW